MTLTEFKNKYLGKTVGYPTNSDFNGECLSLAKWYIKECFGFNPPPSGTNSAYGYWSNFPSPLGNYFDKVENTPSGVPKAGDLLIWSPTSSNSYGHIAIFLEGTASSFKSLDQNWGGRETHEQGHYYTNVKGWLTPKKDMQEKIYTEAEMTVMRNQRDDNWDKFQSEHTNHEATNSKLEQVKGELKQFIETLASKLTTIADKTEIIGAVDRLLAVEDQLVKANKAYSSLETEKNALETDKNKEISRLQVEIEEVQKQSEVQRKQIEALLGENSRLSNDAKRLGERVEELLTITPNKPDFKPFYSVVINFIKGLWQK